MKYGVIAATRPDSPWGRTVRWRCDRYGCPLVFDSEAEARETVTTFNDQRCVFEPNYDNTVRALGICWGRAGSTILCGLDRVGG